jgi:hypothetical protein
MAKFILNETYVSTLSGPYPLESIHRVLWFSESENILVMIRIDKKVLSAPHITTCGELTDLIDRKLFQLKHVSLLPQQRLSDKDLTKRYPAKKRKIDTDSNEESEVSAPVAYRNKWLPIIDEITPMLEMVWRRKKSLHSYISIAAEKHDVQENQTYQVLYRFLAAGSARTSVIPNRFLCGAKGTRRIGKGVPLGRKQTETKLKGLPNDNFVLDTDWLQKIQDTHQETIKRGVSASSAFQTFLNLYCSTACQIIDGVTYYEYLPRKKRPSKVQFSTNGPGDDPKEETWRKQLADKEYEKNYRGLYGNADPETFRTGSFADVDSTSNDRYLVSVFNCLVGVGTARSLPVVDVNIGYIFGIYVGWNVNSEAAKLSILNAASSKVEFCARYGIKIEEGEWYSCLHAKYRADRGEFNAKTPRESLGALNRSIEYTMTGRPEFRGRGEQTHSRLHDHDADGSTHGKNRMRGEKDPAKEAHQNIFDYTRELIRLILYHNNYAPADHLLTTEMRQCHVKPTRRAILEWSMEKGYHHQVAYHEDDLVLELCPEVQATVTAQGVYPIVRRNGTTGDEIILDELRYLGHFVEKNRWLERARAKGRFRITIRMNPNDPTKVWYQDPYTGLHTLTLATKDPLLGRVCTVNDLTSTKTAEIGSLCDLKDEADQKKAEMKAINIAERKDSKSKKKKQQELAKKANINSSTGTDRRKNRQAEVAATGQAPIPIFGGSLITPPPADLNQSSQTVDIDEAESSDMIEQWLRAGSGA